jgi:hypothetical protein
MGSRSTFQVLSPNEKKRRAFKKKVQVLEGRKWAKRSRRKCANPRLSTLAQYYASKH